MRHKKNTLVSGTGVSPVIEIPQADRRGIFSRVCSAPFIVVIRLYKLTLSPLMGGHCRFIPTCSQYALEAYRAHNPLKATWLTARRLLRCHPLGGSGWDPPPPRAGH